MPEEENQISVVRATFTIVVPEMKDIDTITIRRALESVVDVYPLARVTVSISHPLRRIPIE